MTHLADLDGHIQGILEGFVDFLAVADHAFGLVVPLLEKLDELVANLQIGD